MLPCFFGSCPTPESHDAEDVVPFSYFCGPHFPHARCFGHLWLVAVLALGGRTGHTLLPTQALVSLYFSELPFPASASFCELSPQSARVTSNPHDLLGLATHTTTKFTPSSSDLLD